MRIYEAEDYQDMSRKAANILAAQVILKPDCVQPGPHLLVHTISWWRDTTEEILIFPR